MIKYDKKDKERKGEEKKESRKRGMKTHSREE